MVRKVPANSVPSMCWWPNAAANETSDWTGISVAEWDRTMAVNLRGALPARGVYADMRTRGYGKIITVSSVMVELGSARALAYVTSKAGLIGFTPVLASDEACAPILSLSARGAGSARGRQTTGQRLATAACMRSCSARAERSIAV